jgi:COP9 signalosome complex subunit 5
MKKQEQVLGWYHSHPNYGPWLSGIDVATQQSMQSMGPMLAIVIDPIRTQISGKVDIGAFRTCNPTDNDAVVYYYTDTG